jgi:hypothetical protein
LRVTADPGASSATVTFELDGPYRRRIEEKMERKQQEIQELEVQLREAKAYIQALQDVMKLIPREGEDASFGETGDSSMRTGSYVFDARNAIQTAGRPLHIVEILKSTGRANDRKNRTGMSGALAAYVRRREVFTRPKPNTFGLIESAVKPADAGLSTPPTRSSPPDDFGLDVEEETGEETAH